MANVRSDASTLSEVALIALHLVLLCAWHVHINEICLHNNSDRKINTSLRDTLQSKTVLGCQKCKLVRHEGTSCVILLRIITGNTQRYKRQFAIIKLILMVKNSRFPGGRITSM